MSEQPEIITKILAKLEDERSKLWEFIEYPNMTLPEITAAEDAYLNAMEEIRRITREEYNN